MKAVSPQMTRPSVPLVDPASVAAVRPAHDLPERVRLWACEHQVHMVRHQTIGPDLHTQELGIGLQAVLVGLAVRIIEEDRFPAIATMFT
jgi:hypothetical protein